MGSPQPHRNARRIVPLIGIDMVCSIWNVRDVGMMLFSALFEEFAV